MNNKQSASLDAFLASVITESAGRQSTYRYDPLLDQFVRDSVDRAAIHEMLLEMMVHRMRQLDKACLDLVESKAILQLRIIELEREVDRLNTMKRGHSYNFNM
jgi:hypothetical protein